jgi:aminopeptidase N
MDTSRSSRCRFAATVVAAAVVFGAPGAADARGAPPQGDCNAGAPGVGDRYYRTYGNGGYDVRRYDLDVVYNPVSDVLDGRARIRATTTEALCSFNLDLVGLEVRSVQVNGVPATWTRAGQELTVTPRRHLRADRSFRVVVRYDGVPRDFVLPGTDLRTGWMTTPDGATVAGQPEAAAMWFPVNDHPLDKAAYRFKVTVPDGYEVVANGRLTNVHSHNGRTSWRWVAREPMASYLATIDIGYWDTRVWETESGDPVYDAVDSAISGGLRAVIDAGLARQGEILDVLSDAFGPYPFDTVGAIVDNQDDLFFALETQTRPVYSKYFWLDPDDKPVRADWVLVHELAHQWFGDDLALARWQDIWLNEGFATYAEWIWAEHEGEATPAEIFRDIYDSPPDDPAFGAAFWDVRIGDPGVEHLFDNAVYYRGAMTLQALREAVGDEDFWSIIRIWAATYSGGNVTTPEFIALAERVSGQQLDDLFTAWLFTRGKPALAGADARAEVGAGQRLQRSGSATWRQSLQKHSLLHR